MLKKGLSKITQSFKVCKDELNVKLARKESISSADDHWLDHEGNTVDEQQVIETLDAASDYKHGVEALDEARKCTFFLANIFVDLTSDIFCKGPKHYHEKETNAPEEKTKSSANSCPHKERKLYLGATY